MWRLDYVSTYWIPHWLLMFQYFAQSAASTCWWRPEYCWRSYCSERFQSWAGGADLFGEWLELVSIIQELEENQLEATTMGDNMGWNLLRQILHRSIAVIVEASTHLGEVVPLTLFIPFSPPLRRSKSMAVHLEELINDGSNRPDHLASWRWEKRVGKKGRSFGEANTKDMVSWKLLRA